MGACNSAANYETNDNGKPIRDTEGALLNNQEYLSIDQWSCDNVYQWLSTVDNGELKELANKFKNERIKGKVLDSVCDEQLKEMGANIGDRLQFKKARLTLFKDHNYHSPFIEQQQHQQQQTQSHISSRPPLPLHPSRASNESYPSVGNTSGQSNGARMNQNTSFNHSHGHNHNNHSHHHRQQSINTKSMNPPGCNPHQQPQQQQPQPSQHATFDVVASMPGGFPPQTSLQFGDSSQDKSQDLFQQDPTYAAIDINDLNVNGIVNGEEGDLNYMKNNLVNNLINNNVSNKSNKSNKSNSNSNNTNSMSQIIADTKDASDGDMGKCSTNQQAKIKYGPRGLIKNKNKNLSKPGLDRSGSVPVNGDMYPRPISNGSFTNLQNHKHPHSHSNPVYNNHSNPVKHNNHKYNNGYYNKPMLKMAKLLKTSMKNESKTATEIIKILQSQQSNVENKDKMCEIIYNELLDHKILIKDSTMTDTEKYKIDHIKYNKIMDKSLSEAQAIPQPISQAQQSCVGSWGGGTPVTVFSPKSHVWRDGLVLNFDPKTSIGRVCSYNNMGKQSIKELTLPNDYVRPKFDFPPSIPMTAEAWNSTFVNQDS